MAGLQSDMFPGGMLIGLHLVVRERRVVVLEAGWVGRVVLLERSQEEDGDGEVDDVRMVCGVGLGHGRIRIQKTVSWELIALH